jgi:EF-P beta-lysylation protein EpmB
MIPRTRPAWHTGGWQQQLAEALGDPDELIRRLALDPGLLPAARAAAATFGLKVPEAYLSRIRPGDPRDPLLRQVLPLGAELEPAAGYVADPLGEGGSMPVPGLLHKYRGRALLVVTGACPIHCRYCFRRHFPYAEANPAPQEWSAAIQWLGGNPEVHEVLLSGGDPLSLPDPRLGLLAQRLAAIPHLRRLRIHTRMPVVIPDRVTPGLLEWLTATRLQPVMVLHCNHPREIDARVGAALGRLREAGVTLLNQAVLLRGVNDAADTLAELSETLFAAGVLPYYLHLLDPVAGAAHFEVPADSARRLHTTIRDRLPGYLVPRLVEERPGAPAKLPL